MKLPEKIVTTCIVLILTFGVINHIREYGAFELTGDYNIVTCYATLANRLQDDAWVEATASEWENNDSRILPEMWAYVTEQSDVSPAIRINDSRLLNTLCLIVSFSTVPLFVMSNALGVDKKRLRDLRSV